MIALVRGLEGAVDQTNTAIRSAWTSNMTKVTDQLRANNPADHRHPAKGPGSPDRHGICSRTCGCQCAAGGQLRDVGQDDGRLPRTCGRSVDLPAPDGCVGHGDQHRRCRARRKRRLRARIPGLEPARSGSCRQPVWRPGSAQTVQDCRRDAVPPRRTRPNPRGARNSCGISLPPCFTPAECRTWDTSYAGWAELAVPRRLAYGLKLAGTRQRAGRAACELPLRRAAPVPWYLRNADAVPRDEAAGGLLDQL